MVGFVIAIYSFSTGGKFLPSLSSRHSNQILTQLPKVEMSTTYNCTVCREEFVTKVARNNHYDNQCKHSHSLTDTEGKIFQMERTDGKFQCPRCQSKFTRPNNLTRHWKTCMSRDGTESNPIFTTFVNYLVAVDHENDLVENLRYDGMHNLAVCMKCEFALPMEWVQKHFKDHHKILVTYNISYI